MTTTRRIACFDETHGQPHWSQTGFTSRLRTTNFAGLARILEQMDLECVSATTKPLTATFPETRLVVIPPPTGIYDAKHECWHRDPASLFTAQELCALLDFVADGGSVLAFSYRFPYTPNVRGVRTDDWKLIHYPNGDGKPDRFTAELYDLKNDPHEMRNLIADPGHAARRAELERELARVSKAAGPDKMPVYQGITNVLPKY